MLAQFDVQLLERLMNNFGLSTVLLALIGYALWRYGLPVARELVDAHKTYLDRTASSGEKQTEILDRIDNKVDAIHSRLNNFGKQ